jgi:hypothetical protein
MLPEGSLFCLQGPTIRSYHEPDESSPHIFTFVYIIVCLKGVVYSVIFQELAVRSNLFKIRIVGPMFVS